MEYREIKCPHCKETMQAPADRESIICMYCGEKVELWESADKRRPDPGAYERNLEFVKDHLPVLFERLEDRLKAFKKDTYAGAFGDYQVDCAAVVNAVSHLLENAGDAEAAGREVADMITGHAAGRMEGHKKSQREAEQLNMNMFMAVYVLPAFLEQDNGQMTVLTDTVCRAWGKRFKGNNIKAAAFATIQGGFRKKLCYITTAVCTSMHKPEDCYELKLLKNYRDRYLMDTPEGERMVSEYYDIAPTIVKRIEKSGEAGSVYRMIWERYLKPCIACIENQENEECTQIYTDMVRKLQKQYLVTEREKR